MARLLRSQGNTLSEYGLLFGLLVLVAVLAVTTLGGSIAGKLDDTNKAKPAMMQLASLDFSGKPAGAGQSAEVAGTVSLKGKGYYTLAVDPSTGQPMLQMADSSTTEVKNATSVDGAQWNTLGGMRLSYSMEKLAAAQEDPVASDYLKKLAWNSYYLGGVEGDLDNVPGLDVGPVHNIDAYNDMLTYQKNLEQLMKNPPANLDPATLAQALAMASDAYNIAQSYNNKLAAAAAQGDFDTKSPNVPGGVLGPSGVIVNGGVPTGQHYDQNLSYADLQNIATQVVVNNNIKDEEVKVTLTDAQGIKKTYKRGCKDGG